MDDVKEGNPKTKERVTDLSVEEGLIQSLTSVRDTLRAGKRLEERYTMRTVDLQLEPQDYGPKDVKRTRERLSTSQSVFARLLGVKPKTVQSWEQGLVPPPMARRLLDLINENPERWLNILRSAARPHDREEEKDGALT